MTATSPNWLVAPPGLNDPLGFGTNARALGSGPVVLDTPVPTSGRLTQDVSFVLSDGTHDTVGYLRAKATAGFTGTDLLASAVSLTRYAVATRYPGEKQPVTRSEAREAAELARTVVAWAEPRIA